MGLSVIGTGFGRTGTESMRFALEYLGFAPCHHMRQVYGNEEQRRLWAAVVVDGVAPDWDTLFDGYKAAVDWPSVQYWRELIEFYPDAKVLLTWRSAESWWNSYEKTLAKVQASLPPEDYARRLLTSTLGDPLDRDSCIAAYESNVQAVHDTVPAERLLVHKLGDGWEPLCAHLGLPVPDVPYPRSNTSEGFKPAYKPVTDD